MSSRVAAGFLAALVTVGLFAGCLGGTPNTVSPDGEPTIPKGVHPYPSGDEWPAGLVGPFPILEVLHLPIPSFDGITMDGWIIRPEVPEGTKVPIVLWSAPYFGQCVWMPPTTPDAALNDYPSCHYDIGTSEELWDNDQISESVPIRFLVENGYAVAVYNVRGTGNTEGCFEWFGPNEQKDQAVLVEELAALPWSSGRVGMMGLSYHGTTPWEAAIQNPPSLKTIVVAGMVGDAYTFSHTPQGATFTTIGAFGGHFAWRVSFSPPLNGPTEHYTTDHASVVPDRACPEVVKAITDDTSGTFSDFRDANFWASRRLIDQFPGITASVFITHGFDDNWGSGHQQQENAVWNVLTKAPKRMLEGQYGHMFPNFAPEEFRIPDWNERLLEWLDYWLKGIGDAPPRVGLVDYQDGTGKWHETYSWPPFDAREEVLYLAGGRLSPIQTGDGAAIASFNSVPVATFPDDAACPSGGVNNPGLYYATDPLPDDFFLAGNPIGYVTLQSNLPGGLVALHLYDVNGGPCDGQMRRLGAGVADLRFHEGNMQGKNFPIGERVPVRFDIMDFAEVIPAGHRLGLVVSRGDPLDRSGQPMFPTIGVLEGGVSHIVVPVVEGTFGGAAPTIDYPPRPFVPLVNPS